MRKFLSVFLLVAVAATAANASLIISAAVDGTNSDGNPKAIQLMATADIPDLSAFWILRDTNGTSGGPFTVSLMFQLPAVSLTTGDKYVLFGNSDSETQASACADSMFSGVVDGVANHNGDDIFAVASSDMAADAIDGFGLLGQGDTNFAANALLTRSDMTPNAAGVMDAGNFTVNTYSDTLYCDTFTQPVPEPNSLALLFVGMIGLLRRRK